MKSNDTLERVANMIAEFRDIDAAAITGETTFEDLGFDSLDTVELVMAFEDKFGISIEVNQDLKTIGDVVDMIDKLVE